MLGTHPSPDSGSRGRSPRAWLTIATFVATTAVVARVPAGVVDASFACTASGAYTVRSGDSWYGIAIHSDVLVGALLKANDAHLTDLLVPGDRLCLPAGATTGGGGSGSGTEGGCAPGAKTYTVASGDGWYAIAERVKVSPRALLDANGAGADRVIHPGDRLCLPAGAKVPAGSSGGGGGGSGSGSVTGSYTVRSGDSWFSISQRAGITMSALLSANRASIATVLFPGQKIALPAGASISTSTGSSGGGGATYTVKSGDSWFVIATRAGVTAGALLAANGADISDVIHPGDVLRLPAGADVEALSGRGSDTSVTLDAPPTQGPCWYGDTWLDYRSGGRRHVGVDIFTVRGQYIYAVADGVLTTRVWDQPDKRAGNGWWLRADDGRATFFYAHMDGFANGLKQGSHVKAGQIIGYVGATGNAAAVHLHFEVHPHGGDPVNPYPIVKAAGGCHNGTPYTQPGGWVPPTI